jgi:hypothetical protein
MSNLIKTVISLLPCFGLKRLCSLENIVNLFRVFYRSLQIQQTKLDGVKVIAYFLDKCPQILLLFLFRLHKAMSLN